MWRRIWNSAAAFLVFVLPVIVAGDRVWRADIHLLAKIFAPILAIYLWTFILFPFVYMGSWLYECVFPENA